METRFADEAHTHGFKLEEKKVFPHMFLWCGDNPERHLLQLTADSANTYHPCGGCMVVRGPAMADWKQTLIPRIARQNKRKWYKFKTGRLPAKTLTELSITIAASAFWDLKGAYYY